MDRCRRLLDLSTVIIHLSSSSSISFIDLVIIIKIDSQCDAMSWNVRVSCTILYRHCFKKKLDSAGMNFCFKFPALYVLLRYYYRPIVVSDAHRRHDVVRTIGDRSQRSYHQQFLFYERQWPSKEQLYNMDAGVYSCGYIRV